MKIARLLITMKCNKTCSYCCNNYSSIMKPAETISDLSELVARQYDVICITGGEPMLDPSSTIEILNELKRLNTLWKIYLYSALYRNEIDKVLPLIDGMHFTIHAGDGEGDDIKGFHLLQEILRPYARVKSFRLYIDINVRNYIAIVPDIWRRVEMKRWLTEKELLEQQPNGLPNGESLLIYQK